MRIERPIPVALPEWIRERWWRVAYLRPEPMLEVFKKYLEIAPDKRFSQVIQGYLNAYIEKGVAPPADIAPTILNMADDLAAGRDITLKTGDYINLQMHMQGLKK